MNNEFDEVMLKRTDAELVKILNSAPGDYQDAALEAAKREFERRSLSEAQVTNVKLEIEQGQRLDEAKANEPLGIIVKILSFIFPGVLVLMLAGTFKADGYERKGREMVKWTLYGMGFYFGFAVIVMILERFA